jgi:hypothetical protein
LKVRFIFISFSLSIVNQEGRKDRETMLKIQRPAPESAEISVTNPVLLHLFGELLPQAISEAAMITAKVELTQPLKRQRRFVAHTGSGHDFLLDDAAGSTGPKPIELVSPDWPDAPRSM